jgi:transcriptional regulator with XRE-family HTH domain
MNVSEKEKEFARFMTRKFREWEEGRGSRQSVSAYARFLGVKQPTLTRWMQGDSLPDMGNVEILAEKLGPDIYSVLGLPDPRRPLPVDALPDDFRRALEAAMQEAANTLEIKRIDPESEEASKVVIEVFAKHGFKYNDTK